VLDSEWAVTVNAVPGYVSVLVKAEGFSDVRGVASAMER
jgi:hypothetical protein